jgi:hypothetical protein
LSARAGFGRNAGLALAADVLFAVLLVDLLLGEEVDRAALSGRAEDERDPGRVVPRPLDAPDPRLAMSCVRPWA